MNNKHGASTVELHQILCGIFRNQL
uniref:Uncharacterized protein n=1 Tax=Anguilla anguilla TaxID=7936 RepID=A0A0E9RSB2_ANGAN